MAKKIKLDDTDNDFNGTSKNDKVFGNGGNDVYLNVAGGLRIGEPAADLAVAAAVVSSLADEQVPLVFFQDFERTLDGDRRALLDDSDMLPVKEATDVVLHGSAHARARVSELHVGLAVSGFARRLRVCGARHVEIGASGEPRFSSPEPFERLALAHTLAYGGHDAHAQDLLDPPPPPPLRSPLDEQLGPDLRHLAVPETRIEVRVTPKAAANGVTQRDVPTAEGAAVFDYSNDSEFVNPNQHDVGLVFLSRPLTIPSFPTLAKTGLADGSPVVNVGRIKDGTTSYANLYVGAPRVIRSGAWVGYPYAYDSDDVIESGDSGGPCLVTGVPEHEIAAVNSGSSPGSQVLARVDLVSDWLALKIAAHGGSGASAGSASGASPAPTPTPTENYSRRANP